MKLPIAIATLVLAGSIFTPAVSKKKTEPSATYYYGVTRSFTDSAVYLTPVLRLANDSARPADMTHLVYCSQLVKRLVAAKGLKHQMCTAFWFESQQKAEKNHAKLKKMLQSDKSIYYRDLPLENATH